MEKLDNNEKIIAVSEYDIGSWISVVLVFSAILVGLISSSGLNTWQSYLFSFLSIIAVLVISLYKFFNRISIYKSKFVIQYFIRHNKVKRLFVHNKDIVSIKFLYTGARGSGGNGHLKLAYRMENQEKTFACIMRPDVFSKMAKELRYLDIPMNVIPKDLVANN